jgi:3-hydroxybutyryl-CoA dehydratase
MENYVYDELTIGMERSFDKKVGEADLDSFAKITGDFNPLHMDESYAKSTSFGKRVVHGLLLTSYLSTLAGMFLPGKYSLILKTDVKMKKPSFLGDELKISGRIVQKVDFSKIIVLESKVTNQNQEILQEGTMHIQVLK